jgi:hypothetical protein
LDFKVNDQELGVAGSELKLSGAGEVRVTARVAARLDEEPDPELRDRAYAQKPYWHLERARLGDTREVPVELIVNGYPVASKTILADGTMRDVSFDVPIEKSSWVAMRILPSSHTNPIFVEVDGQPIRASKRSAEWCLKGVEQCWMEKERFFTDSPIENEKDQAVAAYDHAREVYKKLIEESAED